MPTTLTDGDRDILAELDRDADPGPHGLTDEERAEWEAWCDAHAADNPEGDYCGEADYFAAGAWLAGGGADAGGVALTDEYPW